MNGPLYKLPKKTSLARFGLIILSIIIFGVLSSLTAATQFVASEMNYSETLGQPMIKRIYNPFLFIIWEYYSWEFVRTPVAMLKGLVIFILFLIGSVVLPIFVTIHVFRHLPQQLSDIHGSARWANFAEIESAGLIAENPNGVYLGAWEDPKTKEIHYLTDDGDKHTIAFAPTRSGKGVGLVIPTLLNWPSSVFVHDIKGENWALTAGYRKECLNNLVIKFDPTCEDGSGAGFNPLQEIRLGTEREVRDVQNICGVIVEPNLANAWEDHWRRSAQSLLVGAVLHVLYCQTDKTLRGVATLLSDPKRPIKDVFNHMLSAPHDPEFRRGWIDLETSIPTYTHPVVAETAREMMNKSQDELAGILSTALSFLTVFRDPILASNTAHSDFRIADLMNHEIPVSLYVIVPPSDIARTRSLVRVILNQISTRLLEKMEIENGRSISPYKHRLLLMLDEVNALGKIESFPTSLAYMAGYGIKAYLIAQDLSQLYAAWGQNESIVSNCHVRIAFAPNKIETAEIISRLAGASTVRKYSKNLSGKRVDAVLHNVSEGEQETGRPLVTADEALRLPQEDCLIFVANMNPIYGEKIKFYRDERFRARSAIPAPVVSDKLPVPNFPTELNCNDCVPGKETVEDQEKEYETYEDLTLDAEKDDDELTNTEDAMLL